SLLALLADGRDTSRFLVPADSTLSSLMPTLLFSAQPALVPPSYCLGYGPPAPTWSDFKIVRINSTDIFDPQAISCISPPADTTSTPTVAPTGWVRFRVWRTAADTAHVITHREAGVVGATLTDSV